jgi:hypothetical protein
MIGPHHTRGRNLFGDLGTEYQEFLSHRLVCWHNRPKQSCLMTHSIQVLRVQNSNWQDLKCNTFLLWQVMWWHVVACCGTTCKPVDDFWQPNLLRMFQENFEVVIILIILWYSVHFVGAVLLMLAPPTLHATCSLKYVCSQNYPKLINVYRLCIC